MPLEERVVLSAISQGRWQIPRVSWVHDLICEQSNLLSVRICVGELLERNPSGLLLSASSEQKASRPRTLRRTLAVPWTLQS
jgi:hypothetical protein